MLALSLSVLPSFLPSSCFNVSAVLAEKEEQVLRLELSFAGSQSISGQTRDALAAATTETASALGKKS